MSSDRTGDGLGVERQREDCAALIRQRGWTETLPPFIENDVSASGRKPRPKFEAMLAAVEAGEIDVVVAWAMDRLTRNARDRLALVEACQRRGVIIALVRGSDLDPTTAPGRMVIGILGEVAQNEIDTKSERQARAAEQAAEQGRWIGGRRPFGYADDGVTIVEAEAAAIVEGYGALLGGVTLRAIASEWNAAGHRTAQRPYRHADRLGDRSPWRADSVRNVLLNPRYAGLRAHRGVERAPAAWPGLVPIETYRAACAVLRDPARRTAGAAPTQFLSGIATCGLDGCGHFVHGGGAKHHKAIYRCRTSSMQPENRPDLPGTHVNRLAAPVDAWIGGGMVPVGRSREVEVRGLVVERLSRPDARDLLITRAGPDLPALRSEANALRVRLESLAAEFGAAQANPAVEPVPLAEYRAMRAPVAARLAEIEALIAAAGRVDILGPLVAADDVAAAWGALKLDRRRAVVAELMTVRLHAIGRGKYIFDPDSVSIHWKDGDR